MPIDPDDLGPINNAGDLFALLRDRLGWPVEGDPTVDFYEEPEIAAGIKGGARAAVYSVVPVGDEDERLIVLAEFDQPYVRKDLRELLRSLRGHMRATARWGDAADAHNTLFIVATPGYDDVRFVLFEESKRRTARIRTFGWNRRNVGRTVLTHNLERLHWADRRRWEEAWNVEGLTDAFYDARNRPGELGLVQVFARMLELTTHPGGEKAKRAYVQHLVNRLLFVSFVERMGWLRPPPGEHETTDYLKWLWDRHVALKRAGGTYTGLVEHLHLAPPSFKALLNKLFFDGLNDKRGITEGHRYYRLLGDVPYLNGGLFEEDETLDVPGVEVDDAAFGLLFDDKTGLFRRFNFTVTESTPLDEEVAVDPEMLGKIFERLIIAEDRHLTGTYYTPRPIVEYMVNEALKGYLVDRGLRPEAAALLVDEDKVEKGDLALRPGEMQDALDWLFEVRAVDPACGSGAYLLTLLQRLFDLVDRLEVVQAKRRVPNQKRLYETKLRLLQRCVYGVDQSEVAVRIAKLRLWLSLVVENHGEVPEPLPNFDFLIMAGDSLASPLFPAQGTLGYPEKEVREYTKLKARYFHPDQPEDRPSRAMMRAKRAEIEAAMADGLGSSALRAIAMARAEANGGQGRPFDWEVDFAEVFAQGEEDAVTLDGRLNLGPEAGRKGQGALGAKAARAGGFDIVLANPPYVNSGELLRSVGDTYKKALTKAYPKTGSGTADLLVFFFDRALQLLRPGGQLAFITSNKWLKAGYGKGLRTHLATVAGVRQLVDFGDLPVFQNVVAYPLITLATKGATVQAELATVGSLDAPYPDMPSVVASTSGPLAADALGKEGTWRLETTGDDRLARMRARGIPLGEYVKGRIYRGVLTGLNEVKIGSDGRMYGKVVAPGVRVVRKEGVFVIDGGKRAELIAEDPKSAEIIKPLVVGKDIRRWRVENKDRWIIVTKIGVDMSRYPAIKRHLAKYEEHLRPRADQGDQWWELRPCAYYDVFDDVKIAYPDMFQEARFSLVKAGVYLPNTAYVIPNGDLYLLAILNSHSFNEQLNAQLNKNIGDTSRGFTDKMKHAFVPRPKDADRRAIEKLVSSLLAKKERDANADVSALEAEIDRRVEHLYFGDAANRSYDEAEAAKTGEVRALLRNGRETPTLEFKENFAGSIRQATEVDANKAKCWIAVCALLNAAGGDLLIGVDDGGSVLGLDADLARTKSLDALIRNFETGLGGPIKPNPVGLVATEPVEIDGKTILRVRVKGDPTRMYTMRDGVYVRRSAQSGPALGPVDAAAWWSRRERGEA